VRRRPHMPPGISFIGTASTPVPDTEGMLPFVGIAQLPANRLRKGLRATEHRESRTDTSSALRTGDLTVSWWDESELTKPPTLSRQIQVHRGSRRFLLCRLALRTQVQIACHKRRHDSFGRSRILTRRMITSCQSTTGSPLWSAGKANCIHYAIRGIICLPGWAFTPEVRLCLGWLNLSGARSCRRGTHHGRNRG